VSREIPAQGTGLTGGPERETMNETDTHETITTGTVAAGGETAPVRAAEEFIQPRGSFASGVETMPEKDAEERSKHPGTFAAGEETTPEKDAEERGHPGSFADSEPTA